MKRLLCLILICLSLTACSAEQAAPNKTIHIASMGSAEMFMGGGAFLNGINLAVKEANEEYGPQGYTVVHTFYEDNDDYSADMLIVDELLENPDITAVFGPMSLSALETAAHRFENAGKLMIAPHGIADQVLGDNEYRTIFSVTFSGYDLGWYAADYGADAEINRWALCYSEDGISKWEVRGFQDYIAEYGGGAEIMDIQKIPFHAAEFDSIYRRWDALGVQGIFIAPYGTDGFELIRRIREKNPDALIIGDYAFDVSEKISAYQDYLEGFVLMPAFNAFESEELNGFIDSYEAEYGERYDTWASHGYDCAGMIIDAAVKNGAADPEAIAALLHKNGYTGINGEYKFEENGELSPDMYSFIPLDKEALEEYRQ